MSLPFEINDAPDGVNKEMWASFEGIKDKYVHVGPQKYLLCPPYRDIAAGIYNLELRPDDVWVVTFPRSGTTLTQELVWLINNDYDYERAKSIKLRDRFPYIEFSMLMPSYYREEVIKQNQMSKEQEEAFRNEGKPTYEKVQKMFSPRHIKTHLPFSLLPPKLLDTSKVIYVARNPKDVAVSYYHQNTSLMYIGFEGDLPKYWDHFQNDLVYYAPYWSHLEEGWEMRDHPNMLFLFYEDLIKDMPSVLRKVAKFLNKSIDEINIAKMLDHLKIDNFRKNPSMKDSKSLKGVTDHTKPGFFRQGKCGEWRKDFTPEMNAKADEWIKAHEQNTDLRFQY
ncbi:sulfotransferase 1C4-like [Ischnura elegans]|uniref:sulfotransferase 1C4-like n=1 Tax=Ischnura elegans TaxID=197161 RepID=UPI001ED89B88|nr:sulfotransferase 1C4-like [Ischnura elegans]XP_046391696.1 sulfotransferase 1C4-like [Ischnura elegans]